MPPVPFPNLPNVVELEFEWRTTGLGDDPRNVLHAEVAGGPPVLADMQALAVALQTWAQGASGPPTVVADVYELVRIVCTDETAGSTLQTNANINTQGTLSLGDPLPPQLAVVTQFRTSQRPRHMKGRVYLPPPTENESDGEGVVDPSHMAAVSACWAALDTALGALTPAWGLVIGSHTTGVITPVTGFLTNDRFDSQRRRAGRT